MRTGAMDIAEDAMSLASGVSGEVEGFAESARTTAIKVYEGSVESLVSAEPQGVGVRVINCRRTGYAYTADLSRAGLELSLIHISEPTRRTPISYAVFCL